MDHAVLDAGDLVSLIACGSLDEGEFVGSPYGDWPGSDKDPRPSLGGYHPEGDGRWHVVAMEGSGMLAFTREPVELGQLFRQGMILGLIGPFAWRRPESPLLASLREEPPPRSELPDTRSVYFIEGGGLIKIGVAGSPSARLDQIQHMSPVPLRLVAEIPGVGQAAETALHRALAASRSHGEWFRPDAAVMAAFRAASQGRGRQFIEGLEVPQP